MVKIFLVQSLVIFLYAVIWFIVAVVKNRNDVADIAWGGGFICAALTAYLAAGIHEARAILVLLLVVAWGVRLMLHIGIRNLGKPEDHRYKAWREEWGNNYLIRSFLQVFLLQGFLRCLSSPCPLPLPSPTADHRLPCLMVLDSASGCSVFPFETIGDFQLLQFKKDPANKGRIMNIGLWRYTRHPDYFGEVTLWWGIFLICWSVPGSLWTVAGPLTISWLILRVSGTPLLKKDMSTILPTLHI